MTINKRELQTGENAVDERRWQAQEKARRLELEADADDVRIARALRNAPAVDLPVDFATQVAARARASVASVSLLEQHLLRALVGVFALSAAVVVGWQGRGWVAALAQALPGGADALGWSGVAAACVVANWGWGVLRRQLGRAHATA